MAKISPESSKTSIVRAASCCSSSATSFTSGSATGATRPTRSPDCSRCSTACVNGASIVRYVEGNRDFFLEDSVYARHFDSIALEHAFAAGGVRYLAVHGDGIDDRDWRYRFWRRASKNAVSRAAARRLPGALARRFVHDMDRRLAETNFEHKIRIPEAVIRRFGEKRLAEGHDVVLLGHFHKPMRFAVRGGEVRIVDAWFNTRRLEWLP